MVKRSISDAVLSLFEGEEERKCPCCEAAVSDTAVKVRCSACGAQLVRTIDDNTGRPVLVEH